MSENEQNQTLVEEDENMIILILKIKQKHLNQDIYFLDNTNYTDLNGEDHLHDNLKELNNTNVDLYINNIKYEFKKYFRPKKEGVYCIKLKFKINLKDCSFMFAGCKNIINIDFKSFITKDVIDMKYMFSGCKKLEYLNLSSFNTKNVTNMAGMFGELNDAFFNADKFIIVDIDDIFKTFGYKIKGCKHLIDLDLSSFDTSNVTNMMFMFGGCINLESINLSKFNTKNVTNMMGMFNKCENLLELDLSSFNTENVTNMMSMFTGCTEIKELNLSSFNTSKVINMDGIFGHMFSLKNINVSSFNTQNVINMLGMFNSCENLQNLDISNFDTKNAKILAYMFADCKKLENLDLSNFNISNLNPENCKNMFAGCTNYKNFHLCHFATIDESILLGNEENNQ